MIKTCSFNLTVSTISFNNINEINLIDVIYQLTFEKYVKIDDT